MDSPQKLEHWIRTLLLLSIVIVTGFIFYEVVVNRPSPYINFSIMNQDAVLGNYPSQVTVGQEFQLRYYVDNEYPDFQNFSVRTYLANFTTSNVTFAGGVEGGQLLQVYNFTLPYGENCTSPPLSFAINNTGTNFRICFELWILNQTNWNYLQNSVQYIWLNCTN